MTGPTHVLASSGGGEIALKLPVLRPDLVASLSLHEPSLHGILRDDPESWPAVEYLNARLGRVVAALDQGDDAGHMPHRTHPDAYARVVTAFLDDIAAPSSKGDRPVARG